MFSVYSESHSTSKAYKIQQTFIKEFPYTLSLFVSQFPARTDVTATIHCLDIHLKLYSHHIISGWNKHQELNSSVNLLKWAKNYLILSLPPSIKWRGIDINEGRSKVGGNSLKTLQFHISQSCNPIKKFQTFKKHLQWHRWSSL